MIRRETGLEESRVHGGMKRAAGVLETPSAALNTTTPDEEAVMSDGNSTTTFRAIPGFPGYRAGDDGSVWSCWEQVREKGRRGLRSRMGATWRQLKLTTTEKGRLRIDLGGRRYYVHRLILEAFVGPCPEGLECCHGDGNPTNNALTNLQWGTPVANAADRERHGTTARGEGHGRSKLTEVEAAEIKAAMAQPHRNVSAIARRFQVSRSLCRKIAAGENWRHLEDGR